MADAGDFGNRGREMIPYTNCQIYGPYNRKDGRSVIFPRKSVSYPKYLKELELGRYLNDNETVDHNDQDFYNDTLSNLIVRFRSNG